MLCFHKCYRRLRQRVLATSGVFLIVYIVISVILHLHLSQVIFNIRSSLSEDEEEEVFFHRLLLPDNISHRRLKTDFASDAVKIEDQPRLLSGIALPTVSGCPRPSVSEVDYGIQFQTVGDDFVYTAYLDDRLESLGGEHVFIRLLAILRKRSDSERLPTFSARVISMNGSTTATTRLTKSAEMYEMCENHAKAHGGWIVSWRLPSDFTFRSFPPSSSSIPVARRSSLIPCRLEVSASDDEHADDGESARFERDRTEYVSIPLFRMSYRKRKKGDGSVSIAFQSPRRIRRRSVSYNRSDSVDYRKSHRRANVGDGGHTINAAAVGTGLSSEDDRLNFAVCVPPLFGVISAATFVQFVEVTRRLGADHFIFYVVEGRRHPLETLPQQSYSRPITSALRGVIDRYVKLGLATAVHWELPVAVEETIWYGGQLMAINDCLYRTSHAFRFVAFNDIDEFIVPRDGANNTWTEMVNDLLLQSDSARAAGNESVPPSNSGWLGRLWRDWVSPTTAFSSLPCGFSFQSAFFPPVAWKRSISDGLSDLVPSYNLKASNRRSQLSHVRHKVMVRPDAVFEVGIHHVSRPLFTLPDVTATSSSRFSRGLFAGWLGPASDRVFADRRAKEVLSVSPAAALVHHYRNCLVAFDSQMNCTEKSFVVDNWMNTTGHLSHLADTIRHVLADEDRHLNENVLRHAAELRRRQQVQMSQTSSAVPPPVYPPNAALQAIRRFSARPPFPELMDSAEGPVTKHIRLTAALILRNLARYSSLGRSILRRHEDLLSYTACSNVEASVALSHCLYELHKH